MKTIGLVGGTTWYSTLDYYRYANEMVNETLGDNNYAQIIINSVNYGDITKRVQADDWKGVGKIISAAAKSLQAAGADCILLGANTMHNVAPDVEASVQIPLIHIARETAKEIKKAGIDSVALLGTKYTMQLDFFKNILSEYGIATMIPNEVGMEKINVAIYDELAKGLVLDPTKKSFLEIIDKLAGLGADGVILGCTEIPMLIKPTDCPLPLFDTTKIHARAAVNFILDIADAPLQEAEKEIV
ncbi:MAG: aspartate/glutamate racemase family protein [Ferruginibacter sp.]